MISFLKKTLILVSTCLVMACGKKVVQFEGTPTLLVTPLESTIQPGATQQLQVSSRYSTSTVTWSIDGENSGSISQNGLYTAPSQIPLNNPVVIRAKLTADPQVQATALIEITAPIP